MKAIGYVESLPAADARALFDFDAPSPTLQPRDLLVRVKAISVNPADTHIRKRQAGAPDAPAILGWDVAGVVEAVGPEARLFKPGDEVFYAGSVVRPGANSELHAVDERIVGPKPRTLSFAEAAALPLTTITAWEALFDRLQIPAGEASAGGALLIIGAGGGVGSIAVQLARRLTGQTVIGTASRPETRAWVEERGAHHVIDHSKPLSQELKRIGINAVDRIFSLTHTDHHWPEIVEAIAPQGRICIIDRVGGLDMLPLMSKSVSFSWEFMFTRSMFQTADMEAQHRLLGEASRLVDNGVITTTLGEHFGAINAANLRRAHAAIESNQSIGKIVLEGF
ncbi:zinc-binding alcohol dehydrogenase family protein [Terrarubrum flagellatum]|uniref:zinc-binding alcohol dehydrogenase family protein n=1 Tax=Terrirubrum flagellatum TaxID=2895980 RepID=UPI003144DA7F